MADSTASSQSPAVAVASASLFSSSPSSSSASATAAASLSASAAPAPSAAAAAPASPAPAATSAAAAPAPPAAAAAAARQSAMDLLAESLKLEHQFLRVPLEHFRKKVRAHNRCVEVEVAAVLSGAYEACDTNTMYRQDAINHLISLASRLNYLKRKSEEWKTEAHVQATRFLARLKHLESIDIDGWAEWNNTRLKRILVDYMLRMSYYDTAKMLAETSQIEDLVDIDVFLDAQKVIDSLRNKDLGPALAWCRENKIRLKKISSKLEFQLRLQEFIELVRANNKFQAIHYAQTYLVPWGETCTVEIQRAMATLAFGNDTESPVYRILFDPVQWEYRVTLFKHEFFRLFGMTCIPLLHIYLQAGLSVLKTPSCFEEGCTIEDPLSQQGFRKLAAALPFSKQHRSKIVCYIAHEVMDAGNPPLVLPNGFVYSTKALEEMAVRNDGRITCPRTGETYNITDLVKAYIL